MGQKIVERCANVERGKVLTVTGDGTYIVASLDRDGIETPPIRALMNGDTYTVGDMVFFFLFSDGMGMIISTV